MFNFLTKAKETEIKETSKDNDVIVDAIYKSMAVIEFTPDGIIQAANQNFLNTVGYSLSDIEGKHHSIFCDDSLSKSAEYKDFWKKLANGELISGEFKRRHSDGSDLWLEASYNPIRDSEGNIVKIVKFASDVTEKLSCFKDTQSLHDALNLSVAVIEFNLDGTVIKANNNFCNATGYSLDNLVGKHHRIFCKEEYASSSDYAAFWNRLNKGEAFGGRFERIKATGEPLWLEATYNPIRNEQGEVYKIVKFASDITERVVRLHQDAESAIKAHELAIETDSTAEKGSEVIHKAVQEMNNISKMITESAETVSDLANQSEQITNIVNTIRGIAEQTNLLALNAAIEAARAGDQGRGFAVVADEVRQLAGRTSISTQEISEMIEKIQTLTGSAITSMTTCQSQSVSGVELAGQAGDVITEIKGKLTEVVNAVSVFSDKKDALDQ